MMRKYYTTFSEKNLTGNAGLVHLGRFAEKLGLAKMIERTLTIQRGVNADYQAADAILMLMMGVLSGIKHMGHTIILKNDDVLRALFRWDKFPDATTFGRIFRLFFATPLQRIGGCGKCGTTKSVDKKMVRQNHLGHGFNSTWCLWLTRGR